MTVTSTYVQGTFTCPGLCSGNAAAAKAFYSKLLGWQPEDMQSPEGEHTMFKLGGEFVAGMYQMSDERKTAGVVPHWNSYIAVDNVEEVVKKAEELGGKVKLGPFDAEGDLMANLQDPLGADFSVWESRTTPEKARLNEVGALCWTELYTTDMSRAGNFYSQLIGWSLKPFESSPMPYTVFDPAGAGNGVGGMLNITAEMKGMKTQWLPYFQVENADQTAERAKQLGAVIHGPLDLPTVGRIVIIQDPEKAGLAAIQLTM